MSLFIVLDKDKEGATNGEGVRAECKMLIKDQIQGMNIMRLYVRYL